jgi:thioredoxin 1
VDRLVTTLFLEKEVGKEANLNFVRDKVLLDPDKRQLLTLYRRVYQGKKVVDNEQSIPQNRLKLSGLVVTDNGALQVRNRIYRRVFDAAWIKSHTAINWAPIVATVAIVVALLALGYTFHNMYQAGQVEDAERMFFRAGDPAERVTHLATILEPPGLWPAADYDHVARELFHTLAPADQMALFSPANAGARQLVILIEGTYTTLADTDGSGSNSPVLTAMAAALAGLDPTEQTKNLQAEIAAWLEGRNYVQQAQYDRALTAYSRAIELNPGNPATRYERAGVYVALKQYPAALADLDQTLAVARRLPNPTPPPETPTATPTPTLTQATATATAQALSVTPDPALSPAAAGSGAGFTPAAPPATPVPAATPSPEPRLGSSAFVTPREMINAVSNLLLDEPALAALLAAEADSYSNLAEMGLAPTSTATVEFATGRPPGADIDDFVGDWANVNPETGGMTRLVIDRVDDNTVTFHGYGACHPIDCDWGLTEATWLQSTGQTGASPKLAGLYRRSWADRTVIVERSDELLLVESISDFTEADGRTDATYNYELRRLTPTEATATAQAERAVGTIAADLGTDNIFAVETAAVATLQAREATAPETTVPTAPAAPPRALTRDEMFAKVRDIILEQLGVEAGTVTEAARLRDDLQADDLDMLEFKLAFEELILGFEIPDEDVLKLTTVGEAVDYLYARQLNSLPAETAVVTTLQAAQATDAAEAELARGTIVALTSTPATPTAEPVSTSPVIPISDDQFEEVVLNASIPVVVHFWAPWSGPSQMAAPILEELAGEYGDQILCVNINTDDNPQWAMKYGIQTLPTTLFVKNGQVVDRSPGVESELFVRKRIDSLLSGTSPVFFREDIFRKVTDIIVTQLGVEESEVTWEADLRDDLQMDDLDIVELIMAIEEEFGLEISDEDAQNFTTVGETVDYLAVRQFD